MEPANTVFELLGMSNVARKLHKSPQLISRWSKAKDNGGYGGRVPHHYRSAVLHMVKEAGFAHIITPDVLASDGETIMDILRKTGEL